METEFTEKQLNIIKILSEQTFSEKNLSGMYQGAIMVKEFIENPEYLYQAAHSLRELTYYMTHHLNSLGNHQVQMKEFLKEFDELGGEINEVIIKQWYDLHNYFVQLCHHHTSIASPEIFEENLNKLENIILSIHGPIYHSIKELDSLINVENPTIKTLESAFSLIKNTSAYEYFIKNLTNPDWLDLLEKAGVFDKVPTLGDKRIESIYLLRICKEKPEKVLDIILRHSETNQPLARINYIKCLIDIPLEGIKKMIKPIKGWINPLKTYEPSIYYTLNKLILKLIELGAETEVFDLLNTIFSIKEAILINDEKIHKQIEEQISKMDSEQLRSPSWEGLSRDSFQEESESYTYGNLIKELYPHLIDKYPLKTFELFLIKLQISISYYLKKKEKNAIEDHSTIWRKILEKPSIQVNFRSVIIDVLIDCIDYIGTNQTDKFSEIFALLKKYSFLIFRRLEYYSCNKYPLLSNDYISNMEFNPELFETIDKNFEMFHYFKKDFKIFSEEFKQKCIDYIENEGVKKQEEFWKHYKSELTPQEITELIKDWQKRKLKGISEFVPEVLLKLGIDLRDLNKINLFDDIGVVFGDRSPLSTNEMESMTIKEIKDFLIKYDENDEDLKLKSPFSKVGLARQLRADTKEKPDKYLSLLKEGIKIVNLHKYLSYIIDGISDSFDKITIIDIQELFSIFIEMLKKEEFSNDSTHFTQNNRREIYKSIADFFHKNLTKEKIPIEFKEVVWDIIKLLLKEKDIEEKNEAEMIKQSQIPGYLYLNTIQGIAFDNIFFYISWIQNEKRKYKYLRRFKSKKDSFFPENEWLEILKILDSYLEKPLFTIHFIFGLNFRLICYWDIEWSTKNVDLIFPLTDDKKGYFESAWRGYLRNRKILKQSFDLLRPAYFYSIDAINISAELVPLPIEDLVSHLILFFIRGDEPLEDKSSLTSLFFEKAPSEYRKIFIREIGEKLSYYKRSKNHRKIKKRLKKLLLNRLNYVKAINQKDEMEELQGFAFWFKNSIFNKRWMIENYMEMLQISNGFHSIHLLETLKEYSGRYPLQTIKCIEILSNEDLHYGRLIFAEEYKELLREILNSKNKEARKIAIDFINHLIKLNNHTFKELLEK